MNKFLILYFFALLALALKSQDTATMVIYPNPFCDDVFIQLDLPTEDTVTISVFNIMGQEIVRIADAEAFNAGEHLLNPNLDSLPSDLYFIRLSYGHSFAIVHRVVKQGDCTATSIVNDKINSFKAYPNPSANLLYIGYEGYKQIEIVNLQGQVCKKLDADINAIDLAGLPSGTYILNVFDNEHR